MLADFAAVDFGVVLLISHMIVLRNQDGLTTNRIDHIEPRMFVSA